MGFETIRLDVDGAIATVRLHRPDRMNAVIERMYLELGEALGRIEHDPDVRCLVLAGSPRERNGTLKPAFCAGADLKEHGAGRRDAAARRAYIELAHGTVARLFRFPLPVVAAVAGPARGAGTEMALACDFVIMADDASLALPETGLGTFVGGGVTWLLPRLVGLARARELIYTGRVLHGPAAVEAGLALRSHPADRFDVEVRAFASELAGRAPISIRHAKRALHGPAAGTYEAALADETETILACMETDDWAEGVRAYAERRTPRFEGR